jgi:hypothetical protein
MTTDERLSRLERENRRFKIGAACALVAALAVGFVAAQKSPKGRDIEATGFFLKDANGKIRGGMVMTEDGPALRLFDNTTKSSRMELRVKNKGDASIELNSANGKRGLVLSADDELGPNFCVLDNGIVRLKMDTLHNEPKFVAYDSTGENVRATLGDSGEHGGVIVVFDAKNKVHWKMFGEGGH